MTNTKAKAKTTASETFAEANGPGSLAVAARGSVTGAGDTVAIASNSDVRGAASVLSESAKEVFAEVARLDEVDRSLVLEAAKVIEKHLTSNSTATDIAAASAANDVLAPTVEKSSMRWSRLMTLLTAIANLPLSEVAEFVKALFGKG